MDEASSRAAQLISEVIPNLFRSAAAQVVQQNSSKATTPTQQKKKSRGNMAEEVRDPTPAGSDEENDEEEYEVEAIMDTKMEGRKRLFLVRWKGYGPDWDTWEPQEMLAEGANEIMKEFMARKGLNKKATPKPPPPRKRATSSSIRGRASATKTYQDQDDAGEESEAYAESSDENDFSGPSRKKTKTNSRTPRGGRNRSSNVSTRATTSTTTTSAAPVSNGLLSSKTPWFMDSDSDDEANQNDNDTQQHNDLNSSLSDPTNLLKLIIKSPRPDLTMNGNDDDDRGSKKDKKHKKKDKKSRVKLVFEGMFRNDVNDPLSFVARSEGADTTQVYQLEDAIESDSRSLARFLANKIVFASDGVPSVSMTNTSASSG